MVEHHPTAHAIWKALEKSFTTKLKHQLLELETKFNILKQGDIVTIAKFAGEIANLVEHIRLGGTVISWNRRYKVLIKGLRKEYDNKVSQIKETYQNQRAAKSFSIRDADGAIRPVTIVRDPIDEKVEYDNIVDQLKAEEIKLGLNVYGLAQKLKGKVNASFVTKRENGKPNTNAGKGKKETEGRQATQQVIG